MASASSALTVPGRTTDAMRPGGNPWTICTLGSRIDRRRYSASATTVAPSARRTVEPLKPSQVGPAPRRPSVEWQERQPFSSTSCWPRATAGVVAFATPAPFPSSLSQPASTDTARTRTVPRTDETPEVRPMRRIIVTVTIGVSLVAFAASPASAHSVSGVGASNFRTELHTVNGQVRGLHVAVVEAASRVEVVNRSGREAVVLGYSGEPYLRVGPDGVFQNIMSPAAYMNASRNGMAYVPDDVNASATPQWRKVSSETVARWHDHRIHWMGGQKPPAVLRDPGHRHVVIPNWVVPIRLGTSTVEVTG